MPREKLNSRERKTDSKPIDKYYLIWTTKGVRYYPNYYPSYTLDKREKANVSLEIKESETLEERQREKWTKLWPAEILIQFVSTACTICTI